MLKKTEGGLPMKNLKQITKPLLTLLVIMLVFAAISPQIFATVTEQYEIYPEEPIPEQYIQQNEDVYVVEEDLTQRGEYEKHFLCSDDSFVAVSYPNSVHFKNKNNQWQEYDNSLKYDPSNEEYSASNNGFTVSLSQNTSSEKLITLNKDDIEISWNIKALCGEYETLPLSSSEIEIAEDDVIIFEKPSDRLVSELDSFAISNYKSQAIYEDVFVGKNVSLKYTLDANRIKEDIIINEENDISSFIMDIDVGELTALLNESNEVELIDKDGKAQYTIGVPCMVDAAFEYSCDVTVTVLQNGSACEIIYTPDENWIKSEARVYPITLDPNVTTKEYASNFIDTYAWKYRYYDQSSKLYLDLGVADDDPSWVFLKFTPPNVSNGYYIESVSLTFTVTSYFGTYSNNLISVYDAYPWSTGSSLQPNNSYIGSYLTSFYAGYGGTKTVLIERDGFPSEDGFVLKYSNESSAGTTNYVRFNSLEAASNKPFFTVSYFNGILSFLPSDLVNNGVYAFKNVSSGKYMTASGSTNNSNIAQQNVASPGQNQLFKINVQTNTGGSLLRAMCSSEGTNRVIDIQSQGAIPANGHNIQIYNNAEMWAFAQEWIFIPLGSFNYKIVLRSNMNLCIAGTSDNDVKLQTYTGSNLQKWTMQYMGCKEYYEISTDLNSDKIGTVNCQGYAFFTHTDPQNWIDYSFAQENSWTDKNTALALIKAKLETNWLDVTFPNKWEDVTNNGGINALLTKNQWLVAMRVGIDDFFGSEDYPLHMSSSLAMGVLIGEFYLRKFRTVDYHFWYRDNTGQWANKHGKNSTSEPLGYQQPTDDSSQGWKLYGYQYYDSNIVYYRITR